MKGTISAIAVGAGSIIFGIAINYSLHYLIHKKHEPSTKKTLKDIASPMIIGSITTVGAFLTLLLISSDAMHDFGLFAAFTLLGTLIFVLIFLPHLFKNNKTADNPFFDKISDFRFEKNKYILLIIAGLTILFFFLSSKVTFNANLNKINYMTPGQREAFEELSNVSSVGKKCLYYVNEGKDLNEALREYERNSGKIDDLHSKGELISVAGIGKFLPSDSMQLIRINLWNNFWNSRLPEIQPILISEGTKLGFKPESFNEFINLTTKQFEVQSPDFFAPITDNFVKDYIINRDDRAMVITLLYVNPRNANEVTNLNNAKSIIFDQSSISNSLVNILSKDFNKVLYICGILVFVFLAFSFGRLELSVISFLPMVISWFWILGIMAVLGINFNIVNIILATFIFGLGDDYTIFMMDGLMNEYAYKRKLLNSNKTSIALSAITMFIGIGILVFAKHPAMKSLGEVTIIGMISVIINSFVLPPLLFSFLTLRKGKPRLIPITFRQQLLTIYSFIAFLIGSIWLTIRGYMLFSFRKTTEKNKLKYHTSLCNVSRFVTRNIPSIKTRFINENNEDFNKPSIIICNHQSHLDLMFTMMLSPKVVILTNEWVWNSPFYGKIIKFADFYPVANGIENSVSKLATLVDRGYSIVIFPEGTRSEDCSILRFHRGAFFLAEKLNLDILPVVIHGIGHAFPKKEFLLRKGEITVKVLDRIKPDDTRFGNNYSDRTRLVRRYYKDEYEKICNEFETAGYYSDLVFHNYIYKGASIEKNARKELSKYNSYKSIIELLPDHGKLLHINCNFGVFDLTCALVKKELHITAIDSDAECIQLATNCASKPNNINYLSTDQFDFDFSEFNYVLEFNPENSNIFEKCKSNKKDFYILADKPTTFIELLENNNGQLIEFEGYVVMKFNFAVHEI
jgi:1-acyl-sn-glycerol-3-phosphate acyltransferase